MKLLLRAWLLDTKEMLHNDEISLTEGRVFKRIYDPQTGMNAFPKDNAILMVYTGLKDSCGRLIYEGDVIRFYHLNNLKNDAEIVPVLWYGDSEWSYPAFDLDGRFIKNHSFDGNALSEIVANGGEYYYEIIGNIYEDGCLLK